MSTEPDFDELVRYLEGDLTQSRARELEASAQHAERVASVQRKLDALGETDPALEHVDLVPSLHEALAAPPRHAHPRWKLAAPALALAAAAALVLVVIHSGPPEDEFLPKGGATAEAARWAGVEVYRVRGGQAVRVEQTIAPSDGLAFAYRNGGKRPFPFLMVFAVDAQGQTFWFFPAWTDPLSAPQSIAVAATKDAIELPEVVRHDLAPGPLVVHALFSRRPFTVAEVERNLAHLEQLPEVLDQRHALLVQPE